MDGLAPGRGLGDFPTRRPVVVGVDGTEGALRAVEWAAREADRTGRPLLVVRAVLWNARDTGEHPLTAATARARQVAPGLPVRATTLREDPGDALPHAAAHAALLTVGTGGHHGVLADMLRGSVGLAVASRADCPVVVVPETVGEPVGGPGRAPEVVLGVGERDHAAAARFAAEAAVRRGCALRAVAAWQSPPLGVGDVPVDAAEWRLVYRDRAERALDTALGPVTATHPGLTVLRHTEEGNSSHALLTAAERATLLVVGAGRDATGRPGPHLGGVARSVLHRARCPVAVVPDTEADAAAGPAAAEAA
ncbi:universal stress protein [Streptomyces bohaiensis]|uniref:universal stress protein n=1 Tax=Streptomyces bohaiensis TaxID=1431344 RepID=UPI003B7E9B19